MKKRSQASTEFLSNYGWAVIVLLVIIGVMARLGILTPSLFVPKQCTTNGEILCIDYMIKSSGTGTIRLKNNLNRNLIILDISYASDNGLVNCKLSPNDLNKSLLVGEEENIDLVDCSGNIEDMKLKGRLIIKYKDETTSLIKTSYGRLITNIEKVS